MPKAPKAAGVSQRAAAAELPVTWPPCQSSYVNPTGSIKLHSKKPQVSDECPNICGRRWGSAVVNMCVCPFSNVEGKEKVY